VKTPDERLAFLLESGRRDVPRGNGRQRALLALDAAQIGEGVEPSSARGALTQLREPSTTSSFLLKLSVVALLSVTTSSLQEHGHLTLGGETRSPSSLAVVDTSSLASAGGSTAEAPEASPPPSTRADDEAAPPVLAVRASALPPPVPAPSPRKLAPPAAAHRPPASPSASAAAPSDSLRDELALVDEASRALALGRCVQAKQALDRYVARFPSGRLRDEVDVISVELIGMRGDHVSAAARAQEFLTLRPKSPYATRLSPWLSTNPGNVGARSCAD
jgi:hypothetical protein